MDSRKLLEQLETATSRRGLMAGAAAGAALGLLNPRGAMAEAAAGQHVDIYCGAVGPDGQYQRPDLPYDMDALEPHYDAETLKLHHGKHHAGYVRGVIAAEKALAEARDAGDFDNVEHNTQKAAFHGAGHMLHSIFWRCMTPGGSEMDEGLLKAIKDAFGSLSACSEQFAAATRTVEGSGWGLLTWSIPAKRLVILQARNHQLATQWANIPLMVCDVWEHAYYLKYNNRRGDFINAFMEIVDWSAISARYDAVRSMVG